MIATAATHFSGTPRGGIERPEQPGGVRGANGAERTATILVVEDEILIRLAVADFLRESGYRVLEASSAIEAQKALASAEAIDLVFSDVTMPGPMDGLDLAAWIRGAHPDVAVILTSGVASVVPAAKQAVAAFVEKPYSFEALAAQIKRLLGR